MEVNVLKEEKDLIEFEIVGEDHTFCNILRAELWNHEDVDYAAYMIKHPDFGNPIFTLSVKKGKPKKALIDTIESFKEKLKDFKNLTKQLQ